MSKHIYGQDLPPEDVARQAEALADIMYAETAETGSNYADMILHGDMDLDGPEGFFYDRTLHPKVRLKLLGVLQIRESLR